MFYATISKDLKALAKDVSASYISGSISDVGCSLFVDLAPYILGFRGVCVDYPQNDFHTEINYRKWVLSDITNSGFVFECLDLTKDMDDHVLFIPISSVQGLQFMFRDRGTQRRNDRVRKLQKMHVRFGEKNELARHPTMLAHHDTCDEDT